MLVSLAIVLMGRLVESQELDKSMTRRSSSVFVRNRDSVLFMRGKGRNLTYAGDVWTLVKAIASELCVNFPSTIDIELVMNDCGCRQNISLNQEDVGTLE